MIMKYKVYSIMSLFLAIMVSCSSDAENGKQPTKEEIVVLGQPKQVSSIVMSDAETRANDGINEFSINLFNGVLQDANAGDNVTVSPLSAILSVGMQANAVDDEGAAKIMKMFGVDNLDSFNSLCRKLMGYIPYNTSGDYKVMFANSAWLSTSKTFSSSYVSTVNDVFNAEVYNVDFTDSNLQGVIDEWCSKKTNETIKQLPFNITGAERYVLLNALYFNAAWSNEFNKDLTTNDEFNGSNGSSVVPMMHKKIIVKCEDNSDYTSICLGYSQLNADMVLILPKGGISDFLKKFDSEVWSKASSPADYAEVSLSLPKFKIEQNRDLTSVLGNMGFPTSGVKLTNAGLDEATAAHVVQESYTDVNEQGTTVSSVTAVYEVGSSLDETKYKSVEMNINKPFLFFVRHTGTGSILMAGRVSKI
jgi:serine protease inhibitor